MDAISEIATVGPEWVRCGSTGLVSLTLPVLAGCAPWSAPGGNASVVGNATSRGAS